MLCDFLNHENPQVLFIMETKCNDSLTNQLKHALNFCSCFSVCSFGLSGGLCLLWKDSVEVSIRSFSHHHIDCSLNWDGFLWRFTGFYGQPTAHKRHFTWDLFCRIHNLDDSPWLVGGDFNALLWSNEASRPSSYDTAHISDFRGVLDRCSLRDMGFSGSPFTWCNTRLQSNQL